MKKVITIVVTIAMILCCVPSLAEQGGLDFSNLSDEQLQYLIDAALAEQEARKTSGGDANDERAGADVATGQIEVEISAQPVYVTSASLIVQSDEYKGLYPDLLQATIVNNSQDDVKDVLVAFMAWDSNNLPVLIKSQFDFNAATYVRQANYTGVNMVPGGTFGENFGLKLDSSVENIATVKAIVVSYETFDGETWTNPLYDQYVEQYAGKKLQ